MRLDGSLDAVGPRALFVTLGGEGANLSGSSRAAQWMLLDQMVGEARGRSAADSPPAWLTPAGRAVLARYLARLRVALDRQALGRLGLSVEQVQNDLRTLVEGQRAGVVMQDARRVPLVVRGGDDLRMSPERFAALRLPVAKPTVEYPACRATFNS